MQKLMKKGDDVWETSIDGSIWNRKHSHIK